MSLIAPLTEHAHQAPPLYVVDDESVIDRDRLIRAAAELLSALGRNPVGEHLAETPRRVADSYIELLTRDAFELTTFPNDDGYDELVLVGDIPFHSLCEHHLLPFRGVAHIGYLPGERIVGLSKLARVLDFFARDLQVQERLTRQVAEVLQVRLAARGVGVVLEAEHDCMSLRGACVSGSRTLTSTFLGELRDNEGYRQEFRARTGLG